MKWYDFFSWFYDRALEDRYTKYRAQAFTKESLGAGSTILDMACGTGQNFPYLRDVFGQDVRVLGVDFSNGMLKRARKRVAKAGWEGITCQYKDAQTISLEDIQGALSVDEVDAVVCALGLTAIPDWELAFERSFDLLKPGGRYVIFDVHTEKRDFNARNVELVARADITRRVWAPLEAACEDFSLRFLDNAEAEFGGKLFVASGSKPTP